MIRGTLLAVIGRRFPVHLIPSPGLDVRQLRERYVVRIWWDDFSWYLRDASNDRALFSFDLPPELFSLYAEDGRLTESRALDLKSDMLSRFLAVLNVEQQTRLITFELDEDWITRVRQRMEGLPRRNEAALQAEDSRA